MKAVCSAVIMGLYGVAISEPILGDHRIYSGSSMDHSKIHYRSAAAKGTNRTIQADKDYRGVCVEVVGVGLGQYS